VVSTSPAVGVKVGGNVAMGVGVEVVWGWYGFNVLQKSTVRVQFFIRLLLIECSAVNHGAVVSAPDEESIM